MHFLKWSSWTTSTIFLISHHVIIQRDVCTCVICTAKEPLGLRNDASSRWDMFLFSDARGDLPHELGQLDWLDLIINYLREAEWVSRSIVEKWRSVIGYPSTLLMKLVARTVHTKRHIAGTRLSLRLAAGIQINLSSCNKSPGQNFVLSTKFFLGTHGWTCSCGILLRHHSGTWRFVCPDFHISGIMGQMQRSIFEI